MFKKVLAIALAAIMCVSVLAACNTSGGNQGGNQGGSEGGATHVFMFKSTGNKFGDLMYKGFEKAITSFGDKATYQSPSETTVSAQVTMLNTLIAQKVSSITISTNGDAGYEEVFKKAQDAGIKIVSADSLASPDYRVTHIDQCDPQAIGSALVQAAVLIVLGVDYPGDMTKLAAEVESQLGSYTGDEIKIGVLSAAVDTPVQNNWIKCMETELAKPFYAGKVSPELDKKYGNDDPTESTAQAQAFVKEDTVDVIISPTTVGIAAAGQVLTTSKSSIKLTGLGLPSEMQGFMPKTASENAFDYVCPYMMLWNVIELGEVAGAASYAAYKNGYDGKVGSTFTYNGKTFETVAADDGGTRVIALDPYVFYKDNMADWINEL